MYYNTRCQNVLLRISYCIVPFHFFGNRYAAHLLPMCSALGPVYILRIEIDAFNLQETETNNKRKKYIANVPMMYPILKETYL